MSAVCTKCHAVAKPDAKPGDPCWRCSAPIDDSIQLDDQWAAEKAAKQDVATMADDPGGRKRRRRNRLVASLVSLLIVAGGAVGLVVFLKAKEHKVPEQTIEHSKVLGGGSNTVSIEIRARPQMDVRVDQNRAGKTPLTIHVPKRGQMLMIEATAPGHDPQFKQVTADHDQTVDFTE